MRCCVHSWSVTGLGQLFCAYCRPLARCTAFSKVWSSEPAQRGVAEALDTLLVGAAQGLTFWRPLPPIGYAILGDCVTAGSAQPTFQVAHSAHCCRGNHCADGRV